MIFRSLLLFFVEFNHISSSVFLCTLGRMYVCIICQAYPNKHIHQPSHPRVLTSCILGGPPPSPIIITIIVFVSFFFFFVFFLHKYVLLHYSNNLGLTFLPLDFDLLDSIYLLSASGCFSRKKKPLSREEHRKVNHLLRS